MCCFRFGTFKGWKNFKPRLREQDIDNSYGFFTTQSMKYGFLPVTLRDC